MIDEGRRRFIEARALDCRPKGNYGIVSPFLMAREQKCYLFRYPIG